MSARVRKFPRAKNQEALTVKKIIIGLLAISLFCSAAAWADVKSGVTTQTRDILLMEEEAVPPNPETPPKDPNVVDTSSGIKVQEMRKNDFKTELRADRPDGVYSDGDKIVLTFKSEKDAYLTILDFTPSGQIIVLFPNKWVEDNFVKAGEEISIPVEGQNYSLQAGKVVGVDVVKAIATNNDVQVYDKEKSDVAGPFSVLKDPVQATRDILMVDDGGPVAATPGTAHPSAAQPLEWSVASLAIATKGADDAPTGFASGANGEFRATAWANGSDFLVGERVFVKILSNKGGTIASLVNLGASSNENSLLPKEGEIKFAPGEILILPRADDKWKLVADQKAGRDSVKARLVSGDGEELELTFEVNVSED
jgi:hypothetical protein